MGQADVQQAWLTQFRMMIPKMAKAIYGEIIRIPGVRRDGGTAGATEATTWFPGSWGGGTYRWHHYILDIEVSVLSWGYPQFSILDWDFPLMFHPFLLGYSHEYGKPIYGYRSSNKLPTNFPWGSQHHGHGPSWAIRCNSISYKSYIVRSTKKERIFLSVTECHCIYIWLYMYIYICIHIPSSNTHTHVIYVYIISHHKHINLFL